MNSSFGINDLLASAFGDNTYSEHQKQVHKRFNDYDIYTFFIGEDIATKQNIRSPLRYDGTETFNIFYPSNTRSKWDNQLLFKDFNGPAGNVFKFVKLWARHNDGGKILSSTEEVCNYILHKMSGTGVITRKKPVEIDTNKNFQIIRGEWNDYLLSYWKELGVDLGLLNYYRTSPCEYLLDEDGFIIQNFKGTQTYAYVIFDKFKLYQPNTENFKKFFNHCPPDYMQGYQQCQKLGNTLFITKSMKDVIVYQAHTDRWEDIIAPHGEGYTISERWQRWMLEYPRIVIIYDFDLAGVKGANRLRNQLHKSRFYNGTNIEVKFVSSERKLKRGRMEVAFKDIADYRLVHSGNKTREKIQELFYGIKREQKGKECEESRHQRESYSRTQTMEGIKPG